MERSFLEVPVEERRADDGRQVEHDELCWDNNLRIAWMSGGYIGDRSTFSTYPAVKTHESAVEVSYLSYACANEDLTWSQPMPSPNQTEADHSQQ